MKSKITTIIAAVAVCLIWQFFVFDILYPYLGIYLKGGPYGHSSGEFFFACIWAPLWEEALFRYFPITYAKQMGEKFILPIVIASSCIFGWQHGHIQQGVLVQGVMGLILSYVYIENGFSYVSSVLTHMFYNIIVTYFL